MISKIISELRKILDKILLFLLAGLYRLHAEDVQHEAIQEELLLHSHAALQVDSVKRLTTIKNYIYLDRRFSFLF